MFAILALFGVALATIMITDTDTASKDDESDEMTASGTLGDESSTAIAPLDQIFADDESVAVDDTVADVLSAGNPGTANDVPEDLPDMEAAATLFGSNESDHLIGGDSDDQIKGEAGDDTLSGDLGRDKLFGGAGTDIVDGGADDDWVFGDDDAEADTLIGGEGDDLLYLGDTDSAFGGAGDDVFVVSTDAISFIEDFNADDDQIHLFYDGAGPAPNLDIEDTADGQTLKADGDVVAVFSGLKNLNLSNISLVAE